MSLYVIQSRSGQFLDKHLGWQDYPNPAQLFSTPHKDIALNQLIELNAKDVQLRASVVACQADERGNPILETPLADAAETYSAARAVG